MHSLILAKHQVMILDHWTQVLRCWPDDQTHQIHFRFRTTFESDPDQMQKIWSLVFVPLHKHACNMIWSVHISSINAGLLYIVKSIVINTLLFQEIFSMFVCFCFKLLSCLFQLHKSHDLKFIQHNWGMWWYPSYRGR